MTPMLKSSFNMRKGYASGKSGLVVAGYVDMSIPFAAGGLYSTTEDLLRWEEGLYGGKLLSGFGPCRYTVSLGVVLLRNVAQLKVHLGAPMLIRLGTSIPAAMMVSDQEKQRAAKKIKAARKQV